MSGFRPSPSRFALERGLRDAVRHMRGRCLNLGAGTEGRYADLLEGIEVHAVDISEPKITQPWPFCTCDAANLPFSDCSFDAVFAVESFEHIDLNGKAMAEVHRAMKPGAILILTTPTHWTWPFEFGRHGPHYYSKAALTRLVCHTGLKVESLNGCGGLIFYVANLLKAWASPFGMRLFKSRWWSIVDTAILPLYDLASVVDRWLPFPPTNWLVVARKLAN